MEKYENKVIQGDSKEKMKELGDESVHLMVTSPPYFNARDYSLWGNFNLYMEDMRVIFTEAYRVLSNHRYIVVNVGGIISKGTEEFGWSRRKYALGAHFTVMLEEIGFTFIDDYIWDKGEPQSKRHLGNPPYPMYQYPVNAYEHTLVFVKHELDKTKIECPGCSKKLIRSNGQTEAGVQSWECSNPKCKSKSKTGRGKRFSRRSNLMNSLVVEGNRIEEDFVKEWRRDIVKITPVHKVNREGKNTLGHTAPFPKEIPEMAIRYFSGKGEIVLDMFLESGTTAIGAKRLGRKYIGIEMDKKSCELSKRLIG